MKLHSYPKRDQIWPNFTTLVNFFDLGTLANSFKLWGNFNCYNNLTSSYTVDSIINIFQ